MDKNTIAVLKDYQSGIDDSFKKIDKKISSFSKGDKSQKKSTMSSLKQELANIKANMSMMKAEIQNLEDPEQANIWNETVSKLKSKIKTYTEKINNLENVKVEQEKADHLDVDANVNLSELNAQQVMDRGDKILDADDAAIKNMAHVVNDDVNQMKNVNVQLNQQQEKLENVDKDLVEMDYSLKRAGKQITSMFKMYSSDKCITCLIVVILIIIVTIIIVSACGGDNKNNFNVPHDIFSSNNKTANSAHYFSNSINIITLILLYLLL
jgi:DNA repair exonuclease SbcCD ATPase subunit